MTTLHLDGMAAPFFSLGEWRPRELAIGVELRLLFCEFFQGYTFPGYRLDYIDARDMHGSTLNNANSLEYSSNDSVFTWHRDCSGSSAWVLFWSDYRPTQVVEFDYVPNKPTTLEPYVMYLVNNHKCLHRAQWVHGDTHPRRMVVARFYPDPELKRRKEYWGHEALSD